jgi:excisionase family DNA binding protein
MSGSNGIDPMVVDEDQAAQMLGISRRMVFEFRSKGELQYVKLGRLIRYRVSDIQMFLERKRIETNSHASGRPG